MTAGARSTSWTGPSPRPACPWSSRPAPWPTTTMSTAGCCRSSRCVPPSNSAPPGSSPSWRSRSSLPRDERDYADGPAGNIGLRAHGHHRHGRPPAGEPGASPCPADATLTTIDPVVDVVGYFEVQPGLLRINKDYGWLRAADVMAEGDPDLLAEVAAETHALTEARRRPGISRRRSGRRRQGPSDAGRARSRSCAS